MVRKGDTSLYQPLDRRIDRLMKAKAREEFASKMFREPGSLINKETAATLARECWHEVGEHAILSV
jgi:hypothetical protein